jgi:hypothetical protein
MAKCLVYASSEYKRICMAKYMVYDSSEHKPHMSD